jgi:hypothetical protein
MSLCLLRDKLGFLSDSPFLYRESDVAEHQENQNSIVWLDSAHELLRLELPTLLRRIDSRGSQPSR